MCRVVATMLFYVYLVDILILSACLARNGRLMGIGLSYRRCGRAMRLRHLIPCHCVGRQGGGTGGSNSFATGDQLEPCGAKGNTVRKFAETIDVDLLIDPGRYSCRGPLSWDVHCLGDQVETGESPSRHSGMASILPLVVTGENVLAMRPGNCSGLARSWLSLSRHTALRGYSWDERCKPTTCCVLSRTTVAVFLVRCAYTFDSVRSPHYGHHRV